MTNKDFINYIKQDKKWAEIMLNNSVMWNHFVNRIKPIVPIAPRVWTAFFMIDADNIISFEFFDFIEGNGFRVSYELGEDKKRMYVRVRSE